MEREQSYFKSALSDYVYEAAGGGAVRHLADAGYTVAQIMERLDYPVPFARVQKTVWEHFLDKKILLAEEPGSGKQAERACFVKEYGKYGRVRFRRVSAGDGKEEIICWDVHVYKKETDGALAPYLKEKCGENGEEASYVSCAFALCDRALLQCLDGRQREYIEGLPWERKTVWHRLDARMRGIAVNLYEHGGYQADCYFINRKEKVLLGRGVEKK